MFFKNGIVVLALWTLLLGPTLCGLGVLVHACLGESTTECHDEVQCSTDPCQLLVLPAEGQHGKSGDGRDLVVQTASLVPDLAAALDLPARCPKPVAEDAVLYPRLVDCDQTLPLLC